MDKATDKQIGALKSYSKNKLIYSEILKDFQFDELSKAEASKLIEKCIELANEQKNGNGKLDLSKVTYGQNFKNGNGAFSTAKLTDEELEQVRNAHSKHCKEILQECEEEYPNDSELQLAMFEKRADKVFTWLERALDEKVRHQRR